MKTIKYFTLFLLTVFLASCKIESGDNIDGRRTMYGAVAFEDVSEVLHVGVNPMTLAQIVDLYMNASTQSERDNINRIYLPYYQITINGNQCKLSGSMFWTFDTKGQQLTSPDAEWSVVCSDSEDYTSGHAHISPESYTIRKEDGTRWRLTIQEQNMGVSKSNANLVIQYMEPEAKDVTPTSGFSIEGEGEIIQICEPTINYQIELALICPASRFIPILQPSKAVSKTSYPPPYVRSIFVDGKVSMQVGSLAVQADLTQSTPKYPCVIISMSGKIEKWTIFSDMY